MSIYKKGEELYRPIKKEGTHLASSKDTDGAYRGALLSDKSNQVVGQAEWVRVNIDSQSHLEVVHVNIDHHIMTMLLEEINEVHEKYKKTMSQEEYQNEVLDVFIISSLLVKKLRKLSETKIVDDEISENDLQKEKEVIQKLTSPDFIYMINQILMKNPAVLAREEEILSELAGYSIIVDNNFIPLESSQYMKRLAGM